jgi:hypothetical protein
MEFKFVDLIGDAIHVGCFIMYLSLPEAMQKIQLKPMARTITQKTKGKVKERPKDA